MSEEHTHNCPECGASLRESERGRCPFCSEQREMIEGARADGISEGLRIAHASFGDAHYQRGYTEGKWQMIALRL